MYGNSKGTKVFSIPVEWTVTETLEIKADSLKEAVEYINNHLDDIPLGTEPEYIDGTYKISADENGTLNTDEITANLKSYGYTEREAKSYDEVFDDDLERE